jgi:TonB family protein
MPLALLLSPDDQAVSAITAVLEEMLVTCERPLDGVSAAQKLNSNTFDLVLVDCENLPAAKLIFDVCRRGKAGNNPVPIAIVDGRAGLPTAFRLGAELILTKPVAKDKARSTIRTAVSRVKKDEPAHTSGADPLQASAFQVAAAAHDSSHEGAEAHLTDLGQSVGEVTQKESPLALMAAASSSQATFASETAAPATSSGFASALTLKMSAAAPALAIESVSAAKVTTEVDEPKQTVEPKLSVDPPPTELQKATAEEDSKLHAVSSNIQKSNEEEPTEHAKKAPKKASGSLVAVFVLVLMGAASYGAWMYVPGFKTLAQPQVDRVLALAGVAPHDQAHVPSPAKSAPQPASAVSPAAVSPVQSQASVATATVPSDSNATAPTADSPSSASPGATVPTSVPLTQPASAGTPALTSVATVSQTSTPVFTKTDAEKPAIEKTASAVQFKADKQDNLVAATSATELPGEKSAIILSSKGADKRLIHSIQPTYPAGVRPAEVQGTLVLKTVVDEEGRVTGAKIIEGNAALANAAISAVRQWRYRPYMRDGKALPFQTIVLVDFQRP